MSNYWHDRFIQEMADIANSNTKSILDVIAKIYLETQKDILKELVILRNTFKTTNLRSSREALLNQTLSNVDKAIFGLAGNTNNIMVGDLTKNYIQTYQTVNDTLKSLGVSVIDLIPPAVEDIIKTPWSGASFSDRIWHNKDVMIYKAKDAIAKGMIRGDSGHVISTQLSKDLNASYENTRRLVETEIQASQTKANVDNYLNNGIDKVEISTMLDSKLCDSCNSHEGKIIPLEGAIIGKHLPPYHPNCRCTVLPYLD